MLGGFFVSKGFKRSAPAGTTGCGRTTGWTLRKGRNAIFSRILKAPFEIFGALEAIGRVYPQILSLRHF